MRTYLKSHVFIHMIIEINSMAQVCYDIQSSKFSLHGSQSKYHYYAKNSLRKTP